MKKAVLIEFDLGEVRLKKNVVDYSGDVREMLNLLECDLINVVSYNDNIDIVVDDTGLFKSPNPVLEVETPYGTHHLAGKLLFLKSKMTEEGVINTGMELEEALNLIDELHGKVGIVGVTA